MLLCWVVKLIRFHCDTVNTQQKLIGEITMRLNSAFRREATENDEVDEGRREREPLGAFSEVDAADMPPDGVAGQILKSLRNADFDSPNKKFEDFEN